jgi:DNA replication protein DnaC
LPQAKPHCGRQTPGGYRDAPTIIFWMLADDYRYRPLIVDDLGCEENARSFGNQLPMADFIRERERQWQCSYLPTFFTSNARDRNDLSKRYGKNICSRLLGMCEFINFKGPDHRLKR